MAMNKTFIAFCVFACVNASVTESLESSGENASDLPMCSSENSVCSVIFSNQTGQVVETEHVCACSHGRTCSRRINAENSINFMDGEWFVTCQKLDSFSFCKPGEVSLVSEMNVFEEPVNFMILCACPNGYDPNGARWTLEREKVKAEVLCKEEQTDNSESYVPKQNLPIHTDNDYTEDPEDDSSKRHENYSAFSKRGFADLHRFYKKRLDSTNSFHKPAPIQKRSTKTERGTRISKRSSHSFNAFYKRTPYENVSAFYKRAPYENLSAFYKRAPYENLSAFNKLARHDSPNFQYKTEQSDDISLGLNKKKFGNLSFYKRGLNDYRMSFYNRNDHSTNLIHQSSSISNNQQSSVLVSGDAGDGLSSTAMDLDKNSNPFKKRGPVWSFYKRSPMLRSSAFYKRRLGSDAMSFYKRGVSYINRPVGRSSLLQNFYKRGPGDYSMRFYKRGFGDHDSRFYKRGIDDHNFRFYKRGSDYHSSRFYKRGFDKYRSLLINDENEAVTGGQASNESTNAKTTTHGAREILAAINPNNHHEMEMIYNNSVTKKNSRFNSLKAFYKRDANGISRFYKRGSRNLSFYKRSPSSKHINNFYKRSRDYSRAFYKRSLEKGPSEFDKRSENDVSSFYKRSNKDPRIHTEDLANGLEESYANGLDNRRLYQDYTDSSNQFFDFDKRAPENLVSFYKRGYNNLNRFY